MTKEEEIINRLPQWTEEFVQREWYREFLKIYPLNKYPSLLEIIPYFSIKFQCYINEFNLYELENIDDFINDLRWYFLNLYYKNINKIIIKIEKKYGEIIYVDLYYHIEKYFEWFTENKKTVIELDKRYNSNIGNFNWFIKNIKKPVLWIKSILKEKQKIKIVFPPLTEKEMQIMKKEFPHLTNENLQQMKKEFQELPQWTEKFIQREWYREFLKIYPLNKHLSLLETCPSIFLMIYNYIIKYYIDKILENVEEFINVLLWDFFLNIYYYNIAESIIKLKEKYGEIVHNDLDNLILCAKWFEMNIKTNVALDKKYNLKN